MILVTNTKCTPLKTFTSKHTTILDTNAKCTPTQDFDFLTYHDPSYKRKMHPHSRLWLLNIPYIASGLFFSNVDSHLPLISLAECNNNTATDIWSTSKNTLAREASWEDWRGRRAGTERLNEKKSTSICKNCEHQQRTCERGWVWGEGRGPEGFKVSYQTNKYLIAYRRNLFSPICVEMVCEVTPATGALYLSLSNISWHKQNEINEPHQHLCRKKVALADAARDNVLKTAIGHGRQNPSL